MAEIDVAIVGAGPVGAALAALAARPGLEIGLFEARAAPSGDLRTLALSHASRERLEEAGAWPTAGATPIDSIHVSQRGGPGRTLIRASEQAIPALGYTVVYAALEAALGARLAALALPVSFGDACTGIDLQPERATVRFASGKEVRARLLVLADGGTTASHIPGIAFVEKDYGQHALVASVRCDRAHGNRAFERFTPEGPMALLPVQDRYALVWTATPAEAQRLIALEEAAFLEQLQISFGDRAGRFLGVTGRASYPLRLRTANSTIALRAALVGNAAQALHPIAGQGLNLGLRDASALAAAITATPTPGLGGREMLEAYRDARRRDATRGVAFTDLLVSTFADSRRLPTWARGVALTALDLIPAARRVLATRMIHGAPT
jgi:2-octaprenyl-6-methoxyphenol hydroxylase